MDLRHTERDGVVTGVRVIDGAKRAVVDFESDGDEFSDMTSWKFAFSQLLKFANLRKSSLKDDDGEVLPDAGDKVLESLEGRELTFKYNKQRNRPIIAIVSPDYATLPSDEVEAVVREKITSIGISDFDFIENGAGQLTEQFEYVFRDDKFERQVPDVGDVLRAGISVKNSVFGASSLRVSQYITILACQNGMTRRKNEAEFKRVHMGVPDEIRERLSHEVEAQVESIWENTDLIQNLAHISFPVEEQLKFLSNLVEKSRLTKTAASNMALHIVMENGESLEDYLELDIEFDLPEEVPEDITEWNADRKDAWGLLNAFTGYTTHSELSGASTIRQMERMYNDILHSGSKEDILTLAE